MSCYKCNIIKPPKLLNLDSNYCPKCGASLKMTCGSCNGRGKNLFPDKYCDNCGDAIYYDCSSCGGTGNIKNFHNCFLR
ncbi:hypothetical protein Q4Q34_07680 [Flavivirga abyssicola]|uniref:hypothetical protein n=1 Tax=Flavivirga abyssicola TaxID=3063533 RepID=UPI0026E0F67D|nr:hypothetical protein [Flavivirga sp. MEBiC07777]WVK14905.1 hypothetical protein Q4Q34_07680 [Flavivirga sp. MEBiC07777]